MDCCDFGRQYSLFETQSLESLKNLDLKYISTHYVSCGGNYGYHELFEHIYTLPKERSIIILDLILKHNPFIICSQACSSYDHDTGLNIFFRQSSYQNFILLLKLLFKHYPLFLKSWQWKCIFSYDVCTYELKKIKFLYKFLLKTLGKEYVAENYLKDYGVFNWVNKEICKYQLKFLKNNSPGSILNLDIYPDYMDKSFVNALIKYYPGVLYKLLKTYKDDLRTFKIKYYFPDLSKETNNLILPLMIEIQN